MNLKKITSLFLATVISLYSVPLFAQQISVTSSNAEVDTKGVNVKLETLKDMYSQQQEDLLKALEAIKKAQKTADQALANAKTAQNAANAIRNCNNQGKIINSAGACVLAAQPPATSNVCAGGLHSNCILSTMPNGHTSGTCQSGYNGGCSYICSNGTWKMRTNYCEKDRKAGSDKR